MTTVLVCAICGTAFVRDSNLNAKKVRGLGELIHAAVQRAIEVTVEVELTAALGAPRYARCGRRYGYRDGTKTRALTGPTGPLALTVPAGPCAERLDAGPQQLIPG